MKFLRRLLARLLPAREMGPPTFPTRQEALFFAAAIYRRELLLRLEVAQGRYSRVTPAHLTYEAIQERVKRGYRRNGRGLTPGEFLREIQRQGDA